jgi:hypothetical protein
MKAMTPASQQPEHCEHKNAYEKKGVRYCDDCMTAWEISRPHDTRTRPHTPAPDDEQRTIIQIKRDIRRLAECDPAIKEYLTEQWDKAARTATLAENKRVLDKMAYWLKSNRCPPTKKKGDGCDGGCGMCMIESLRTTAAQEQPK